MRDCITKPSVQVLGGTANVGSGVLTVKCTALAADSAVAKVSRLVEQVISCDAHPLLSCLLHVTSTIAQAQAAEP